MFYPLYTKYLHAEFLLILYKYDIEVLSFLAIYQWHFTDADGDLSTGIS